jgi:hypothetical protein
MMMDHLQHSVATRNGIRRFVIIIAFLGELVVLAMFYSATLLAASPFGRVRVSMRRQVFNPRRSLIAEPTLPQSKLLKGVLGVMRVAVNSPVIASVGFPLMSYA